jgi:hydroxyacid-oxoacid transhydrogenase
MYGTLHDKPSINIDQTAKRASSLLRTIQFAHPPSCPCHSNPGHHHHGLPSISSSLSRTSKRSYATPLEPSMQKEYAFEMAASSIRFGPGVTQEVGMDFKNMGTKRLCVVTDKTVDKLFAMQQVRESLERERINYVIFSKTRIEPKDSS